MRQAVAIVAPDTVRPVVETQGSIPMLMHGHRAACQSGTPAHRFDLQMQILKAHGIVAIHRALPLQAEDIVQIGSPARHKRTPGLLRLHLKTTIELGHVMLAQEAIGSVQGGAPRQPQFLG